ncbi:MAG: hypothetical protein JWN98_2 [Abditibacteriota bacterium]|nr:hypothetical protein [Abditibacteriota bacterium]
MPVKIEVYSDYVCPYCLLAKAPLQEAVEGQDVEIEWMPFELRPYPEPTLLPEDPYLPTVWNRSVYPMAASLGVEIKLPTVSPQPYTALAFEGYQHAKTHGNEMAQAYNDRMLRAFFQENQNIGEIDVLTRLAEEIGLEPAEFRQALEEGRYRAAHQQALQRARELGVHSVPTFVIGDRVLSGVHSVDTLRKAIQSAQAEAPLT